MPGFYSLSSSSLHSNPMIMFVFQLGDKKYLNSYVWYFIENSALHKAIISTDSSYGPGDKRIKTYQKGLSKWIYA